MRSRQKTLLIIIAVTAAVTAMNAHRRASNRDTTVIQGIEVERSPNVANADDAVERAFRAGKSNIQVSGQGVVARTLPDDNDGSRHQRFILNLPSGRTLLIAHNIDLAPRIQSLRPGDVVTFFGEYEWNDKGGVLHWTHRDPQRRHADGWVEVGGRRYQ